MEKDIKLKVNINDALQIAAFMAFALEIMNRNSKSPADEQRLQPVRRFALLLNEEIVRQTHLQALNEAIAENNSVYRDEPDDDPDRQPGGVCYFCGSHNLGTSRTFGPAYCRDCGQEL